LKPGPAKPANVNPEFSNIQAPPADISVSELKSDTVDNPVPNDGNSSIIASPAHGEGKNEWKGQMRESRYNDWRCLRQSDSPAWDKIIESLTAEIKMRHYSRKTLNAYADWSRKFQDYLKNKTPDALTADDVKAYLTYLAVDCKVAASTQNQAFNALLFLFRHILKKDFGEHKDIPRAKKSTYIPIVLSRQEIDSVLKHLSHPYNLVVKLLYGCGLRLFEGVKLRVKDFNFADGVLTVRGKGNKSRTVPIPQKIFPELMAHSLRLSRISMTRISLRDIWVYFSMINLKRNIRKRQKNSSGSGSSRSNRLRLWPKRKRSGVIICMKSMSRRRFMRL
jgi:integrase